MAQALDYSLRCNSLTCRAPLTERAVVTTCSHIFCLSCSNNLGLSQSTTENRRCPACQSVLLNPDDAVSTILNPTEDYKTSVLSGLDPNTVMECAGRALAFWTYQTTQEIFYQEYLGKGLTEKYAALSKQMDKVVHEANSEILGLQNKIQDMQMSREQLLKKNQELVELYRDKSKKHAQVTNLYNILKSRAMRTQIQTAATDSISQTLDSLGSRRGHDVNQSAGRNAQSTGNSTNRQNLRSFSALDSPRNARTGTALGHYGFEANATVNSGVDRLSRHQRSGSGSTTSGSNKERRRMTMDTIAMPPPPIPGAAVGRVRPETEATPMPRNGLTPAHRTRLGTSCGTDLPQTASHHTSSHHQQRPATHLFKHGTNGTHTIVNHRNPNLSSLTATTSSGYRSNTSHGFTPASSLFTPNVSQNSSRSRLGLEDISERFGSSLLGAGMKFGGAEGNSGFVL